ncbi:MAG: SDR family oxidoreductase [Bacteroidetes bacterium]|nr:SDR family oxidoreductase [Bacteroidota bacterium]
MNKKRVLITGHAGYIGSVMAPEFVKAGYDVTGIDTKYFGQCTLVPDEIEIPAITKDIRDLVLEDLAGFDCVVHLAALSNDPIGNLNNDWTDQINYQASVKLAKLAREAGVSRFLFSSSCIMYGMSEAGVVNEDSPLDPKTEYARSKVKCEHEISKLARDGFSPIFLRNGTVYGISPRMRFDTVLNNLMGFGATTGKVTLNSNGEPWRPVVHVEDVSRAFGQVLEAPMELIHNQAFNTGAEQLNYKVIELAQIVTDIVPGSKIEIKAETGADQRTYKADFTKFKTTFPEFEFKWTAEKGAKELYDTFTKIGLTHDDYVDKKFTRLKWLNYLLDSGKLDNSLRWN